MNDKATFAGLTLLAAITGRWIEVSVVAEGEDWIRGSFRLSPAEWTEMQLAIAETIELRRKVTEMAVRLAEIKREGGGNG